jgi:1,4-alpha-glucan branching enzyme
VTIVGDFNNWDKEATPMKKLKNGDFTITLGLASGREYRFRYLIDGKIWENDWCADKYVKNPYGAEDSVVCT